MNPIVDSTGRLLGAATRADALRWRVEDDQGPRTLFDVISDVSIPVAHPDEVVGRVADRMVVDDLGRVPVVDHATWKLVGLIARKDLLRTRAATGSLERERRAFYVPSWRRRPPPPAAVLMPDRKSTRLNSRH